MTDSSLINNTIKELHSKTEYKTFYALFNISEYATMQEISDAYRKLLMDKSRLESLPNKRELITDIYNILKSSRVEYERILNTVSDKYTLPISNSALYILGCIIFLGIFILGADYAYAYIMRELRLKGLSRRKKKILTANPVYKSTKVLKVLLKK